MSYIGREPQIGNFQMCDAISVVNGQASYTMQVGGVAVIPGGNFNVIASVNGVVQKAGTSFTISSSTITFSQNLVTGDVIDFILILGSVLDLGVPSDGTVTTGKIADNAVTNAKLANSAITLNGSAVSLGGSATIGGGNTPAFGAKRSNAQTASQDTWTKVDFDTEIYDSDGKFDISNDRFTPTVAGTYIIHGQLANNNLYNQAYLAVAIYKNGSLLILSEIVANNSTSNRNYTVNVTAIDVADTDDYYELYGIQGLGAGVPITEASRNIFMGYKIA